MRVLDLFSGIGGFSLGLERAGMETVAFCEYDKKAQLVLKKHWPAVPIFDDIRELTYERILAHPRFALRKGAKFIGKDQDEDRERDANQFERPSKTSAIDVVCGGFPCQPWSGAGKQRGHQDDRDLWPEMLRVIREVQPRWVIGENVQGFINKDMGLPRTIADLEGEGYETRTFVIPACGVSAPHQRYRVWVIGLLNAHSKHLRSTEQECQHQRAKEPDGSGEHGLEAGSAMAYSTHEGAGGDNRGIWSRACGASGGEEPNKEATTSNVAHPRLSDGEKFRHGRGKTKAKDKIPRLGHSISSNNSREWWAVEPSVGRVVDGISTGLDGHFDREPDIPRVATGVKGRADRLKQLGNAVVPQIVEVIGRAIIEAENPSNFRRRV
jgi:DNA (cytosine-5)-methyltransferase 1